MEAAKLLMQAQVQEGRNAQQSPLSGHHGCWASFPVYLQIIKHIDHSFMFWNQEDKESIFITLLTFFIFSRVIKLLNCV